MNAGARINPIVCLGDRNSTTHLVGPAPVADRKDLANACFPRSLENSFTVVVEPRIIQMSVGIDNHHFTSSARRSRLPHEIRRERAYLQDRSRQPQSCRWIRDLSVFEAEDSQR